MDGIKWYNPLNYSKIHIYVTSHWQINLRENFNCLTFFKFKMTDMWTLKTNVIFMFNFFNQKLILSIFFLGGQSIDSSIFFGFEINFVRVIVKTSIRREINFLWCFSDIGKSYMQMPYKKKWTLYSNSVFSLHIAHFK